MEGSGGEATDLASHFLTRQCGTFLQHRVYSGMGAVSVSRPEKPRGAPAVALGWGSQERLIDAHGERGSQKEKKKSCASSLERGSQGYCWASPAEKQATGEMKNPFYYDKHTNTLKDL